MKYDFFYSLIIVVESNTSDSRNVRYGEYNSLILYSIRYIKNVNVLIYSNRFCGLLFQ